MSYEDSYVYVVFWVSKHGRGALAEGGLGKRAASGLLAAMEPRLPSKDLEERRLIVQSQENPKFP